eukprot:PhM_4_TR11657/c0_g2_i1/m.16461
MSNSVALATTTTSRVNDILIYHARMVKSFGGTSDDMRLADQTFPPRSWGKRHSQQKAQQQTEQCQQHEQAEPCAGSVVEALASFGFQHQGALPLDVWLSIMPFVVAEPSALKLLVSCGFTFVLSVECRTLRELYGQPVYPDNVPINYRERLRAIVPASEPEREHKIQTLLEKHFFNLDDAVADAVLMYGPEQRFRALRTLCVDYVVPTEMKDAIEALQNATYTISRMQKRRVLNDMVTYAATFDGLAAEMEEYAHRGKRGWGMDKRLVSCAGFRNRRVFDDPIGDESGAEKHK